MILELENTIENLKQTNIILEERIKLLEGSKEKVIHDKYFSSDSTAGNPSFNSCNQASRSSCMSHHFNSCFPSCCCPRKHNCENPDENQELAKLHTKVSLVFKEIESLKLTLPKLSGSSNDQSTKTTQFGSSTCSHNRPDSHSSSEVNLDTNRDDSINSVDENVPIDLNWEDPTTQLHQLRQNNPSGSQH